MRPRVLRRRLILAGLGGCIAAATITTGIAKATPLDDYVVTNAPVICAMLDASPSVAGVENLVAALVEKGLTGAQSGEVIGRAIIGWCPSHAPEARAFAQKWGGRQQV